MPPIDLDGSGSGHPVGTSKARLWLSSAVEEERTVTSEAPRDPYQNHPASTFPSEFTVTP
jgi:hypothetical protein